MNLFTSLVHDVPAVLLAEGRVWLVSALGSITVGAMKISVSEGWTRSHQNRRATATAAQGHRWFPGSGSCRCLFVPSRAGKDYNIARRAQKVVSISSEVRSTARPWARLTLNLVSVSLTSSFTVLLRRLISTFSIFSRTVHCTPPADRQQNCCPHQEWQGPARVRFDPA